MTLCELATANYQSPPLECASFSLDAQTTGMATTHRLQRDCVEYLQARLCLFVTNVFFQGIIPKRTILVKLLRLFARNT